MKPLTVVIPSYNTFPHLGRTPARFLSERVRSSVDFLFVDDGSTDGKTGEALEEIVRANSDCCRLVHQENKGHGGAINTGCSLVSTPFFKVMDGDDELDEEGLYRLASYLRGMNPEEFPDIVINPYWSIRSRSRTLEFPWRGRSVSEPTLVKTREATGIFPTLHSLTFRTSFYRETGTRLPEHVFYEDNLYSLLPLVRSRSILLLPWPIYLYFREIPGQSTSRSVRGRHKKDSSLVFDRLWDMAKETILRPDEGTSLFLENMVSPANAAIAHAIEEKASRARIQAMLREFQEIGPLWRFLKERRLVRLLQRTGCRGLFLLRPLVRHRAGR